MEKFYMFNIIVSEGLKPRIERVVRRFFGKWMHISSRKNRGAYNIVVLEDKVKDHSLVDPLTAELKITEDMTDIEIAKAIEHARSLIRLSVGWRKGYVIGVRNHLDGLEIHPAYDVFMAWPGLNQLMKIHIPPHAVLVEKLFGGKYRVFCSGVKAGELFIPDDGCEVSTNIDHQRCMEYSGEKPERLNRNSMLQHINVARRFLDSLGKPDRVIVSFSGGKDSLVALDLAVKHYGAEHVEAIYVDTGVDFPSTRDYVKQMEEELGVTVYSAYAPVKEHLSTRGLPSKNNRWCTLLKTRAFKEKLREITRRDEKILVIVGDRDTESETRSRKPPVRRRKWYLEAAPIKQWSTLMVQLYIKMYELPLNPLYEAGFYRLGCYICPALTSLERRIMIEKLWSHINTLPWINEYFDRHCPGTYQK